jgi:hypothetical protein
MIEPFGSRHAESGNNFHSQIVFFMTRFILVQRYASISEGLLTIMLFVLSFLQRWTKSVIFFTYCEPEHWNYLTLYAKKIDKYDRNGQIC